MADTFDMFINGEFTAPASGEYFDANSPSSGEAFARIARGNESDVEKAVAAAKSTRTEWASMNPMKRGEVLKKVAVAIRENINHLADIESREMGMPSAMSPWAIDGAAEYFDFYGSMAPTVHGDTVPIAEDTFAYTVYEPYGTVAVVSPWNGPANQAARSAAPALAAGNTVVCKPSEFGSIAVIEMARIAHEAGLPAGVFNVVTGYGNESGVALTSHPEIEKIAFTGSVNTGRAIGKVAADRVVPVTMELGGKSPDIVFEDAKLEVAAPKVVFGFILNSGQVCTSGTRILVQRSIFDKFSKMLVEVAENIPVGIDKPMPTLGPIANKMQFDKVLSYLESAQKEGATCLTGGEPATGEDLDGGMYIKPTIYSDVTQDMTVVKEEIFGPVGVLIPFDTEEEAIEIANNTDLGLAAGVWSQDASRVHRVVAKLQAGSIYINDWHGQAVELPMGGYKRSGIGRERGMQAIKSYMQTKNVLQKLI